MKKLIAVIILVIPLCVQSSVTTPASPWGACVWPSVDLFPNEWDSTMKFYRGAADSAVAAGISWARLTGMTGVVQCHSDSISFGNTDSLVKALDERDLNMMPQLWPRHETDAVQWVAYWDTVVKHYKNMGLKHPIKYWKIMYEPQKLFCLTNSFGYSI